MAKQTSESDGGPRLFEFRDGKSDKFWEITLSGNEHTVRYGRVGTDGQSSTKAFADGDKARASHDKLIAQKLKKGYQEIADKTQARSEKAKVSQAEQAEHEPFITAILDDPDNFDPYGIYSDWLSERGDPRGELIQLQWQLEDESLSGASRKAAEKKEKEILRKQQNEWLEELAPELTDQWVPEGFDWGGQQKLYSFQFSRGFLDSLHVAYLFPEFATKLRRSSAAKMLRSLHIDTLPRGEELVEEIEQYADREWDWDSCPSLDALASGKYPNLRELKLLEEYGCHIIAPGVHKMLKGAPRLETLVIGAHEIETAEIFKTKMPALRSLSIFHTDEYPIEVLAKNSSLGKLESIEFQPHAVEEDEAYIDLQDLKALCRSKHLKGLRHLHLQCTGFGDEGIAEIIASGILNRLETLKLPSGQTTDEGAELLLASDLGNLKNLDLSANYLSDSAADKLKALEINVNVDGQYNIDELAEWQPHLYDGDIE